MRVIEYHRVVHSNKEATSGHYERHDNRNEALFSSQGEQRMSVWLSEDTYTHIYVYVYVYVYVCVHFFKDLNIYMYIYTALNIQMYIYHILFILFFQGLLPSPVYSMRHFNSSTKGLLDVICVSAV